MPHYFGSPRLTMTEAWAFSRICIVDTHIATIAAAAGRMTSLNSLSYLLPSLHMTLAMWSIWFARCKLQLPHAPCWRGPAATSIRPDSQSVMGNVHVWWILWARFWVPHSSSSFFQFHLLLYQFIFFQFRCLYTSNRAWKNGCTEDAFHGAVRLAGSEQRKKDARDHIRQACCFQWSCLPCYRK